LGINLAGVQVVLHMTDRMYSMEQELKRLNQELQYLRAAQQKQN